MTERNWWEEPEDPIEKKAYSDALAQLEPYTAGMLESERQRYLAAYKGYSDSVLSDPWFKELWSEVQ